MSKANKPSNSPPKNQTTSSPPKVNLNLLRQTPNQLRATLLLPLLRTCLPLPLPKIPLLLPKIIQSKHPLQSPNSTLKPTPKAESAKKR